MSSGLLSFLHLYVIGWPLWNSFLSGNQTARLCAESLSSGSVEGESLQKIPDLELDRACQRIGMLFWWTTLVVGFGALFGNFVARLF
jgi:hypothetical protein